MQLVFCLMSYHCALLRRVWPHCCYALPLGSSRQQSPSTSAFFLLNLEQIQLSQLLLPKSLESFADLCWTQQCVSVSFRGKSKNEPSTVAIISQVSHIHQTAAYILGKCSLLCSCYLCCKDTLLLHVQFVTY